MVQSRFLTIHQPTNPSDPDHVSIEEATRRDLARRAEFDARPHVMQKRAEDAAADARMAAEKNAKRKRPKLVQSTDYPWLKPGWVESPVRPFKRK